MVHAPRSLTLAFLLSCLTIGLLAQPPATTKHRMETTNQLSAAQQAIVAISAFTAQGNLPQLKQALNAGLDAGLPINDLKEILVQLYAYAGFPRSLNALHCLMDVLNERKQKGTTDVLGNEPAPYPANKTKRQLGTELQTRLVGRPVAGAVYEFAPAIDQFLKEHLFGDIFGRDNLDWKTRELATISALAALGGADNQLRSHFGVGLHNGLTEGQLTHLVAIVRERVGLNEGYLAEQVWQTVLKKPADGKAGNNPAVAEQAQPVLFPTGDKITNANFVGTAWLQQLVQADSANPSQVGSVTFEPGARTNWHAHPGGQILLITDGTGYYQEQGSAKRIIRKGEVIQCPPNLPHWHGATADTTLIQIAITNTQNGPVVWLKPVTDDEYHK